MSKEQLLQEFAQTYEDLMETATLAAQRGVTQGRDGWGPREIVAHLAGWEVMASVRIPRIVAGMPQARVYRPNTANGHERCHQRCDGDADRRATTRDPL